MWEQNLQTKKTETFRKLGNSRAQENSRHDCKRKTSSLLY